MYSSSKRWGRLKSHCTVPSCHKRLLSFFPLLVSTEIQLARIASLHRKFKFDFIEAERLQDLISEVHAIIDLARDLFRSTKQVRIVNRESAYAHQSVQCARQFRAIDSSHLSVTLQQITIRTLL